MKSALEKVELPRRGAQPFWESFRSCLGPKIRTTIDHRTVLRAGPLAEITTKDNVLHYSYHL